MLEEGENYWIVMRHASDGLILRTKTYGPFSKREDALAFGQRMEKRIGGHVSIHEIEEPHYDW
jgi:hypothetical protein